MEQTALRILERIARNLPAEKLAYRMIEAPEIGPVYIAWGKDGVGRYHGVGGIGEDDVIDMARTLEFKEGSSIKQIRAALIQDAVNTAMALKPRGLASRQYWKYNG